MSATLRLSFRHGLHGSCTQVRAHRSHSGHRSRGVERGDRSADRDQD